VTRDHWVEVELPQRVLANQPLWLIAEGWLQPTDSSINVALSQARTPRRATSAWKWPTAKAVGSWRSHTSVSRQGKNKAILVD
jgi:hypothetical protein